MSEFDVRWKDDALRRLLVPGKEVLAMLNSYLQGKYGITISTTVIIDCFKKDEIPPEMDSLIEEIEVFRKESIE